MKKVIVAVHGVGDQYSFATLQSVVNQFCGFYHQPAAMPLGSFHTGRAAFSIHPPYPQDPFERLAFAEVYWAKIPRDVVDEKHTMEESKKWAATIVERLRMRWKTTGSKGDCRVFLATAAFLYLWWLAALTFDLVFVWHLHIRQARALARMDEIIGTPWGGARGTGAR